MKLYLLAFMSMFSSILQSTILNVSQLYNSELKKTVILAGDMHQPKSLADSKQVKDVINAFKQRQAHFIVECGISQEVRDSSLMFLPKLFSRAEKEDLSVVDVECRKVYPIVASLMMNTFSECKNYSDVCEYWLNNKEKVYNLFMNFFDETYAGLDELENLVSQIESTKLKELLVGKIESMNVAFDEAFKKISPLMEEDVDSVVNVLIKNIFIEDDLALNTDSILHKLERINYFRIECNILKEIDQSSNSMLFVASGSNHTDAVEAILKECNFLEKNRKDLRQQYFESLKNEKLTHSDLFSQDVSKYAVDMKKFMRESNL